MTNPITAIQKYYDETVVQLKKCTWPTKKELYESTIVVVSSLVLLAAFVMIVDWVSGFAVRFVTSGF
ncbi:MAG: preprotein translocase subunit SecE [Victivallales bacterium]|jgi:preprotein translocase subunit SecE|nr:preprotein translocase subunit SecE [Victivallales bacterium]